jgi:hypothetical protein
VIDDAMANVGARSLLSSLSMQTAVVAVTWLGRGGREESAVVTEHADSGRGGDLARPRSAFQQN